MRVDLSPTQSNGSMEQPCFSSAKVCHYYQDPASNGHFSVSPYSFTSMSSSELSCSFISSTTAESVDQISLPSEWNQGNFAPNQRYSPSSHATVTERVGETVSETSMNPASREHHSKCDLGSGKCANKKRYRRIGMDDEFGETNHSHRL